MLRTLGLSRYECGVGGEFSGPLSWWQSRVRFHWPVDQEPDMSLDALVANEVFGPAIQQRCAYLELWRFHRRAVRDASGHQFDLIFYTDATTAAAVFKSIEASPILRMLTTARVVERVIDDRPELLGASAVEATSDQKWQVNLQRAWPSFIMGVSASWLQLIRLQVEQHPGADSDLAALRHTYYTVSQEIDKIWHKDGQHAFLHHLSAIYGYQPLSIQTDVQF